jgi:hypothetical protein
MYSIATTEILPWLQHAAVVIGGKNGAGALHTRIRPVSAGLTLRLRQNQNTSLAYPRYLADTASIDFWLC